MTRSGCRLASALLAATLAYAIAGAGEGDDESADPGQGAPARLHGCRLPELGCKDGQETLLAHEACEPVCKAGTRALGPLVCLGEGKEVTGPGCVDEASLPKVPASAVDAVPDATSMSDMVFPNFKLVNVSDCLLYPLLPGKVKGFIKEQAGKYGPSAAAIRAHKHLGKKEKTEFFISIEQTSILLAQLLCGATVPARRGKDGAEGGPDHPQAFAYGRAMEHWYLNDDGSPRGEEWRRTTLVGYGTFDNAPDVPGAQSTVSTPDLTITAGCGSRSLADWGVGDTDTMTVVFAGHYIGGWMTGWHKANTYGAQEEKFGTLIPEMMLATEPLRQMGAGLLSSGHEDPWLSEGGWYIIGAGTYVKSKGYPKWSPDKIPIQDSDYFEVGTGRRMRRRGLVAIMAKPCNDRGPGTCGTNTDTAEFKCYNKQVKDNDMSPKAANLWGIAAGAFDFANWPAQTRSIMEKQGVAQKWTLQAGGWGAGAFGCGTLYNGLVQALAAKKGGWTNLRMCYATRDDPTPTIESKLSFILGQNKTLTATKVLHPESYKPLMTHVVGSGEESHHHHHAHHDIDFEDGNIGAGEWQVVAGYHGQRHGGGGHAPPPHFDPFAPSPASLQIPAALVFPAGGKYVFTSAQFGGVAGQLHKEVAQKIIPPVCSSQDDVPFLDRAPQVKCNRPGNHQGTCLSSMKWCCFHQDACDWSRNKEDLRDFVARSCNPLCGKAAGICKADDVPDLCRTTKDSPAPAPSPKHHDQAADDAAPPAAYAQGPVQAEDEDPRGFYQASRASEEEDSAADFSLRGQQALQLLGRNAEDANPEDGDFDADPSEESLGEVSDDIEREGSPSSSSRGGMPWWTVGLLGLAGGIALGVGSMYIAGVACFDRRKRGPRAVRLQASQDSLASGADEEEEALE
eukprot:TRINITY_DN55504_c0_g1_i1.p1 TRINITY_DN55504_c0_g1~~TRINITY_DN55504_c0_g1_i1.p1  ORF type:complete len:905 (-),score=152.77 TRINITY_DN55504_c0_g1_i1:356-3070(-)